LNDYVKVSGRTDLVLSIGKDGKVDNVRALLGNKVDTAKATEAV